MKTNTNLRNFLFAIAAGSLFLQKSSEAKIVDHGSAIDAFRVALEKGDPEYFALQKQAGSVIRKMRIQAGLGETIIMKALSLDPSKDEEVSNYMAWEMDQKPLELTAEHISAVAKIVKVDPVVLAAQIINSDSGAGSGAGADANAAAAAAAAAGADANAAVKSAKFGANEVQDTQKFAARLAKKLDPEELKTLNDMLLKSQQVTNGADIKVEKSAEVVKLEKAREIGAAILGLKKTARERLEKDGVIAPEDFEGGSLTEQQADTIYQMATPDTSLLSKVQTVTMTSLKQEVLLVGTELRTARRYGTDRPAKSEGKKPVGIKRTLEADDMDLFFSIDEKVKLNFQGRLAGLDQLTQRIFTKNFGDQGLDLAINGITDVYNGAAADPFITLGKGWIQLAVDAATGGNAWRSIADTTATYPETADVMDALRAAIVTNKSEKHTPDHAYILSEEDFDSYELWRIANRVGSEDPLVNGAKGTYRGHPIFVCPMMKQGKYLYTPTQNLVFAYVNAGSSGVRTRAIEDFKAIDIMMSIALDFDLVDYDATVVATITAP